MSITELSPALLPSGKLADHSLVELLGIAFAHRRSGRFMLLRGRATVTIHVFNGIPVNAESSSPGQGILDLMVHDHRLSPDDVGQVKKLAESKGMDIERCLRELLEVTESQIYYYRQQAVRALIIKTCGWRDGLYSFYPGDAFMSDITMYDLNPLDLIYEGVLKYRSTTLAAEIHALEKKTVRLTSQNREYFLLPGPLYDHSDVLDIFTDGIRVATAVATLKQEFSDLNTALIALYLLLITGLVGLPAPEEDEVFDAEEIFTSTPSPLQTPLADAGPKVSFFVEKTAPKAASPNAATAPEPKTAPSVSVGNEKPGASDSSTYVIARPRKLKKSRPKAEQPAPAMTPKSPSPPAETPKSMPPPESPAPAPPPPPERKPKPQPEPESPTPEAPAPEIHHAPASAPLDPKRTLLGLVGAVESSEALYEVLGAGAATPLSDLQRLYAERRRLLLDALEENPPADLRARTEQALKKIEEAATTLADPINRVKYERELVTEEIKRAWNMTLKKALGKKMRERGNWYMQVNAPESARTFFDLAIELDADNPNHYMELGWAIFRHRPQQADEAVSYLDSALKIDPRLDKAYYYLGVIAKRGGDNARAEKMFRKCLDLNPEQEPARRELAYLQQHQKQTGLWKKLFGG